MNVQPAEPTRVGEERSALRCGEYLCSTKKRGLLIMRLLRESDAFSMIEVALAIAVIGIAAVSILGLFAVAINISRDATDDNITAQLVQAVITDRRSWPAEVETGNGISSPTETIFKIPRIDQSFSYYLLFKKSGGIPCVTNQPNFKVPGYYYEVAITNGYIGGKSTMDIRVSWPVSATNLSMRMKSYYTVTSALP